MIFIIVFTTVIFGYIINTIGNILEKIQEKNSKFEKEKQIINRFFLKHQTNIALRTRVEKYIEYIHDQEKNENKEDDEFVINRLSGELRNEIIRSLSDSN